VRQQHIRKNVPIYKPTGLPDTVMNTQWVLCSVFFSSVFFRLCSAGVYQLDNTSPGVSSNGQLVQWSNGYDAFMVASSLCVRVNNRGVYTKPAHWATRVLSEQGWTTFQSTPDPNSLCAYKYGRVFPISEPKFNPTVLNKMAMPVCTSSDTHRHLTTKIM
jgi:hypothetical protein